MEAAPLRRWRFGRVELDEREQALKIDGRAVEIERKPLLVLRHLLEHAGEVVAKDALVRAVWPGRIITDGALAKSVGRLRDALEDREQALVRTHHGFGYRFVAEVTVETLARGAAAPPAPQPPRQLPPETLSPPPIPEPSAARDAERRPLTVLFCDLVDSTRLADRLDAEAFRELLIAYRGIANAIGARYEAHLAQQSGDGLLMYFGYPAAHDNDAERAVRCACDLLRAVKEKAATLALRVGIHSGEVVIGELGGDGGALLATGASLHLAARLQALAEPDSILISDATFRLVPGLFVTRDYGPQLIRGIAQPVRVHQALHPSGVRSRLEAAARLTPLVGREMEIALLENGWQHAVNGEGRAVLFLAEPGLGKSRLLMEIRARLAGRPYSWHECRADALNRHSAFHPVAELIRSGLALRDGDDEALRLSRLEQGFSDVQIDPAQAVPLLGPLLGISPTDKYPPSPLAPAQKRKETLALLAEWIERLADQQPLVLAFEDLHWIDESSLDFLAVLQTRLPRLPVLLVMTARLEFNPPWAENQTLHLRTLEPLPLWEVERMLGALTGGAKRAPALSLLVYERAGGVPLFVEELTRSLIESGQIVEREGQLAPRVPLGELAVPVSLHGLLLARLDRLGVARELIQIAAVIGREVPLRLLLLVAGLDEARLRERLARLVASGLLHGRPDDSYVFKHALIRDSAYETLLKTTREKLHGRIARTLEEHFPERAHAEPAVLAGHLERAAQLEAAAHWYRLAAVQAIAMVAFADVIRHAESGLHTLASVPHGRERDRLEAELRLILSNYRTWTLGFGHADVEAALDGLVELCRGLDQPILLGRALCSEWLLRYGRGELPRSLLLARELTELGDRSGIASVRASGWVMSCWSHWAMGDLYEARRNGEAALEILTPDVAAQSLEILSYEMRICCLIPLSFTLWNLGYPEQALRATARADAIAEASNDPSLLAWVYSEATPSIHVFQRLPARVFPITDKSTAIAERYGFVEWLAFVDQWVGLAQCMTGAMDAGLARLDRAEQEQQARSTVSCRAMFCALRADVCLRAGLDAEAQAAVDRGFAHVARSEERSWEAELHRVRGELLLRAQPVDEAGARTCFERALSIAVAQRARSLELRAALGLARLLQRQDRGMEARALLLPVFEWFTEGFDDPDLAEARACAGALG